MVKLIQPTDELYRKEKDNCPLFFWNYKPSPFKGISTEGCMDFIRSTIADMPSHQTTADNTRWVEGYF